MDFNLTDEQQMLLESVDEFCERYFTEDVEEDVRGSRHAAGDRRGLS